MKENDLFVIENGVLVAYKGMETELTIPEEVHTIGDDVFKGMAKITKIVLPSGLRVIGNRSFKGCRLLTNLHFPDGLEKIGEYAFHRCHGITEVLLPKSVVEVSRCAFLYCDHLEKIEMEGPKKIGSQMFSNDVMLKEVALNAQIDYSNFVDEVFMGCVKIKTIRLSNHEVYHMNNLIEVMNHDESIPKVVHAIADSVYNSMEICDGILHKFTVNLKNIVVPEGIRGIGKACFYDKKGISKIVLPSTLERIDANAFLNCINLTEIEIQNEDLSVHDAAFRGCCNLKKITLGKKEYDLAGKIQHPLVGRIKDQIMKDFYVSGTTLVKYLGTEEQVQIPDGVEIIAENCFAGNEQVKTVSFPESLKEIRENAFTGCVTLQNIVNNGKLLRIEREAFDNCKKLLKFQVTNDLTYIGENAFRRCFVLKRFDPWPENVQIGEDAFYKCKAYKDMQDKWNQEIKVKQELEEKCYDILPYSHAREMEVIRLKQKDIKRIGKYAYANCHQLEEIIIDAPDCVIEEHAFSNCVHLKRVILRVKEIGKSAFSYCKELETVKLTGNSTLADELFAGCAMLKEFDWDSNGKEKNIGKRCFDECCSLEKFDFSDVTVIGERAFERCDGLLKLSLPALSCGFHAFADCAGIKHIEIAEETELKSGAFFGCTQVEEINYRNIVYNFMLFKDGLNHSNNTLPNSVQEVISSIYTCFEIWDCHRLEAYLGNATKVTIPADVEEILADTFRNANRVEEIVIPKSVKKIGSHAFENTKWLEEQKKEHAFVMVNDLLVEAGDHMESVEIPEEVNKVCSWAFAGNCKIRELKITKNRLHIEELAFRNCMNLCRIEDWDGIVYEFHQMSDLVEKPYPQLVKRIFEECINCFKIDESGVMHESTGNIKNLVLKEGIKEIGEGVYQECHLLETIALANSTQVIGKSSFENGKWLQTVTNAKNVKQIGQQAFSGCQSLKTITLSDELEELGKRCFEHCCSLEEIYISTKVKKIPARAFFRCKSLKKVIIPESVEEIEEEAFAFCEQLEEVILPDHIRVGNRAFAYCKVEKVKSFSN